MPKVIVYPNPIYNPIGVRTLLGEVGVTGPMLQDETSIKCVMTEDQISRFRNSRGAAHWLEIVPEAPPPVPEPQAAAPGPVAVPDPAVIDPEILSDDEPRPKDPAIQDAEDDDPNAGGSDSGSGSDPDPKRAA